MSSLASGASGSDGVLDHEDSSPGSFSAPLEEMIDQNREPTLDEVTSVDLKIEIGARAKSVDDYLRPHLEHPVVTYCMIGMVYLVRIFSAISISVISLTIVFSFYGIIIWNFVFFISTIMAYVLSPLYHSLAQDWIGLAFALSHVILATPIIEFFIYFILNSVIALFDSFLLLISAIKDIFVDWALQGARENVPDIIGMNFYWEMDWDEFVKYLLALVGSVLFLILGVGIAAGTFFFPVGFIIIGLLPYLLVVLQIFCLFVPTYFYWGRLLFTRHRYAAVYMESFLTHSFQRFLKKLEGFLDTRYHDNISQTYASAILPSRLDLLDQLSGSDSNSSSPSYHSDACCRKAHESLRDSEALQSAGRGLIPIFTAREYFPLFDYSLQVGQSEFSWKAKKICLWIFTVLDIGTLVWDVIQYLQSFSLYFMISIVARAVFLPLISFFNITVVFFHEPKNPVLNIILRFYRAFTMLILIGSIVSFIWVVLFSSRARLDNLAPPDHYNYTIDNRSSHPTCQFNYKGISVIDAIGFALGPYDVERRLDVFENQMKYFFGERWSETITYQTHHFDADSPYLVYHDSARGMNIVAFRGFSSGSELTLQIEMVASEYLLPIFYGVVPFYDTMETVWLNEYLNIAHNLGNYFFDPVSLARSFMDRIMRTYEELNSTDVFFTGINVGGLFAKAAAVLTHQYGLSFLSFPVFNDFFSAALDFSESDAWYIANVHNYEGVFTRQEPQLANNLGIPWIPSDLFWDLTIFRSFLRDTVYKSFCTLAEQCGEGEKFHGFCIAAIGETVLESIRTYLAEEFEKG